MPDQLVTVGTYSTAFEANLVKAELQAFDLDAVVIDDGVVNLNWLWSNLVGGVKVRVTESDAAEACRILELENENGRAIDAEIACPVCGCRHSHTFVDKRGSFLTWLLLGVPVIPAFSKRICDDCGCKFKT